MMVPEINPEHVAVIESQKKDSVPREASLQ